MGNDGHVSFHPSSRHMHRHQLAVYLFAPLPSLIAPYTMGGVRPVSSCDHGTRLSLSTSLSLSSRRQAHDHHAQRRTAGNTNHSSDKPGLDDSLVGKSGERAKTAHGDCLDQAKHGALSSSVIYFAVKRKNLLAKIGHTDDWERRRKEHERNGWDIQGWQCEPKATEKRFIWVLKTHGVEPVGGAGFREVYPLNEAFLQTARNFGWPLGVYTNPTIWRRSSLYSKPGRDSGQKDLFNGAA